MSLLNNKYLFVHINKSGGAIITKNMELNGNVKITGSHKSLKHMLQIAEKNFSLKKENLYIFTIVRNPWDRMLSMYLFYHKNNFNSPEFFSGNEIIDNNFNLWIRYIYSDSFDRNKKHGDVNIYKYCFSNQLNWIKDDNDDNININKILKFENNELKDFFENELKLKKYNIEKKIHPTNHEHYSKYYNEESIQLVRKNYQEDIDYFSYNFEKVI